MGIIKPRYALYAATVIAGGLFLLWPEADIPATGARPDGADGRAVPALPPLASLAESEGGKPKRDLFAAVAPVPVAPPPPPPPAAVAAPPPPDRFAGLNVVGVIGDGTRREVLVAFGDDVHAIAAGEPFGQDQALRIESIEGRTVLVTDGVANISKTFLLSEE